MSRSSRIMARHPARPQAVARGITRAFAVALALACVAQGIAQGVATAAVPEIGPWLAKHCGDCHAGGEKEGGLSLDGVAAFADTKPDAWATIYEQVQLGLMPPAEAEQPSPADRSAILAWIAGSMRQAGHHVQDKLALPNYANYVPHEPLFRGPAHPAPATRARAWRVRPEIYGSRVPGTQPFSLLQKQQVWDSASLYEVDESAAEVVLGNAQALVEAWTTKGARPPEEKKVVRTGSDVYRPLPRRADTFTSQPVTAGQFAGLLDPQVEPTPAAIEEAVTFAYERALGRKPRPAELTNIRELYAEVLAAHGRLRAVKSVLVYPFLEPEAYYRLEVGVGEADPHGRRRLPKEAIVLAMQQTLFGNARPPRLTDVLTDDAATLATRADVTVVVRDLLDGEPQGRANARVLAFFDEFFDYRKATDVFKEDRPNGIMFTQWLVINTENLIARIVADDRDVFRRLLTTREAFVNSVGAGPLCPTHLIYNLPLDFKVEVASPPDFDKVDSVVMLDPAQRCGILTQPSWLVAHSGNFDNDPVRRGKWVLEHLLGLTVPDIPITVCASVPEDPKKTLRERFRVVSDDSYCWKCHERMNQLGMAFESYDHFGRARLRDELAQPVDASGAVVNSGVPALDGPVKDAVELIERLAASQRAEEMFVRYAFRFFLGRNETLRDAQTIREAHEAYVKSQGSMKALVTSLLSSDSFLYRFEPTP